MLCDQCRKQEALIHFRDETQDKTVHLCLSCARAAGYLTSPLPSNKQTNPAFQRLADELSRLEKVLYQKENHLSCPVCRSTLRDVREENRAGCAECYRVFRPEIVSLLEEHAEIPRHRGKIPRRLQDVKLALFDLAALEEELAQAVDSEDYEKAAVIRDRILSLQEAL